MTKILTQYKMSKSNSLQNSKVFVMRGNVIDLSLIHISEHTRPDLI